MKPIEQVFTIWVRIVKNGDVVSTSSYESCECYEACWDKVHAKIKSIRENDPEAFVYHEFVHACTSIHYEEPVMDCEYEDSEEE
jgi:hypothetical protein